MEGGIGRHRVRPCVLRRDRALRMAEKDLLDLRGVCCGRWEEAGWTPYGSVGAGRMSGLA